MTLEWTTSHPEQIVRKLHEAVRLVAEGRGLAIVLKTLGASEEGYYRWREAYGQLSPAEARRLRELEPVALEVLEREGVSLDHLEWGTMIELPRAAVTAGEIAEVADFFSFGTNDLTQTAFGFSRDDIGKFLRT